jgi:hypothetical protein
VETASQPAAPEDFSSLVDGTSCREPLVIDGVGDGRECRALLCVDGHYGCHLGGRNGPGAANAPVGIPN